VRAVRADWIALDGDGRNDPADIPRLLAVAQSLPWPANLQMVSGRNGLAASGINAA